MQPSKLRRQIAWEAARLMYQRQESEYYRAKLKAARRICQRWVKPADLPSNAEIRDDMYNRSGYAWRSYQHRTGQSTIRTKDFRKARSKAASKRPSHSSAGSVFTTRD